MGVERIVSALLECQRQPSAAFPKWTSSPAFGWALAALAKAEDGRSREGEGVCAQLWVLSGPLAGFVGVALPFFAFSLSR